MCQSVIRPALAVLALLLALAPAAQAQTTTETRSISVEGTASRQIPNDTGRFTATVTLKRSSATAALAAAARRTRKVLAELRGAGVARRDLRTGSVSVRRLFRYDRRTRRSRLVGYQAQNTVRVTVREVSQTGVLIDTAVRAGATGIGRTSFSASGAKALYLEVLGEAFDSARAKAELLAARAGLTLGPARSISEAGDEFSGGGGGFAEGQDQAGEAPASATPVRPGRSTVEATVSVVFDAS
jgi:uncharacterized protein YggE